MHVVSATTAEAELSALDAELRDLVANVERGAIHRTWRQSRDISERLALCPWRFGRPARELIEGHPIAQQAECVLERVAGRAPPRLELAADDSYSQLLNALLLELSGREEEADAALTAVEVHHFCGNCGGERQGIVNARRSESAERAGDRQGALAVVDGRLHDPLLFGAADPVSATRQGLLLSLDGREDEGIVLLQYVVDLHPATPAAEVAHAALEQMGAYIEPTLERLVSRYVEWPADSGKDRDWQPHRQLAIAALGRLGDPAAFDRLCRHAEERDRGAIAGLAGLHDERARPALEKALVDGNAADYAVALEGLQRLNGGARSAVDPLMRRLADPERDFDYFDDAALDERLRSICGGGPDIRAFDRLRDTEFGTQWVAWLQRVDEETGAVPRPAPDVPPPVR